MRARSLSAALFGLALYGCSASDAPRSDGGADAPDVGRECTLDTQCNDRVDCTIDRCERGRCTYEPAALRCSAGSACDPTRGCLPRRSCATDTECADNDPCTADERCVRPGGYCVFDSLPNDTPCGDGRTCRGGTCACPLATPVRCGDACVDTMTDPNHCGGCGSACGAGSWCGDGRCACSSPQTWCPRSGCTDLAIDNANCGACGNTCAAPATCQERACVQPCPPSEHRCGGACVTSMTVETCGMRCTPCPTPEHGRAMCMGGGPAAVCAVVCDAGYHACGARCADNNAEATCGDRCSPCPTPEHGTVACRGGGCQVSCESGYHACGGTCVSNTLVASCGDRCTPCPSPDHGVAACVSGSCDFTCQTGFMRCGDICSDGTSPLGCGPSCTRCAVPSNGLATCTAGSCGFRCNTGYHACGTSCGANLSPLTCGTRCEPCPSPAHSLATCDAEGTCGFECDPGFERDGDACRELPRLVWPPSGSFVTGPRPTFRWSLPADAPGGATVEICRNRACSMVITSLAGAPGTGRPAMDLPLGALFWRVRAGALSSPTWELTVNRAARADGPVVPWGDNPDFNGDGYSDLAVGAPLLARPGARFYVYRGTFGGITPTGRTAIDDPSPPRPGMLPTQFAWVLSAADFNGDGYSDIAVGAPGYENNVGRAYLYLSGMGGVTTSPAVTLEGPATERSMFGSAVASAGDLNADGYNDLVVGAPNSPLGRIYVYFGNGRGVATTPSLTVDGSMGMMSRFGASLAGAGDTDNDGFSDLVVGAPEYTFGVGRAFVFRGSATGLDLTPTSLSDAYGGRIGSAVAGVGDVNGDGYPDIALGAPAIDNGTGRAHVYHGGAMGVGVMANTTIVGPAGMEGDFGTVVVGAGDTNGDGYADLLVSAPRVDTYTGRAYLFRGSATGVVTPFAQNLFDTSAGTGALFGGALAGARDIDNDGFSDVAITAERASMFTGQVTILRGGATGLGLPTVFTGPEGMGTRFGVSVAWREQVCRRARPGV